VLCFVLCVVFCVVFVNYVYYFDVLSNTSFAEHLPEDGHNRWPKHVAGYAVCITINFHICMYTCGRISNNESSAHGHESLQILQIHFS
jgi:hypothetical protein